MVPCSPFVLCADASPAFGFVEIGQQILIFSQMSGRGAARAEDAQGTPTQSHISPSILVYEDYVQFPSIGFQ